MSDPSHERQLLDLLMDEPERPMSGLELAGEIGMRAGTIYPTLARLELKGWIQSRWEARDDDRPRRRLYRLTNRGRAARDTA